MIILKLAYTEQKPYIQAMPSRNVVKTYVKGGYYHVYNRGIGKMPVFKSAQDYEVFLEYLQGYLSPRESRDRNGKKFCKYHNDVELLAFCLMPTHYHLQIRQLSERGMAKFMHALITAFTMYKNKKLDRRGQLFQGSYRASYIENEAYALTVSVYIHNNPGFWIKSLKAYPYSSLRYYSTGDFPDWMSGRLLTEVSDGDASKYMELIGKVEP